MPSCVPLLGALPQEMDKRLLIHLLPLGPPPEAKYNQHCQHHAIAVCVQLPRVPPLQALREEMD